MTVTGLEALLPTPRQIALTGARVTLPRELLILLDAESAPLALARRLKRALQGLGLKPEISASGARAAWAITLRRGCGQRPQGYRLDLRPGGCAIEGADAAGLFYGVCTLQQLLRLHAPAGPGGPLSLPALQIEDWPDLSSRGVMLDISRDRVPTMTTLLGLVDLLAGWKINQLQLYTEHTFAYRGHEAVWRGKSPMTGEQILRLDAHCRARHVELVPNQNSLGHMHRWLIHEPYRALAECPEGIVHPFSPRPEPYGLCPVDPGSLSLVAELYDQLLPHFTSPQVNVGLDETIDLGRGRSAAVCAARGAGSVYVEFLRQVHALVSARGRTMQYWGDMIHNHPDQIPRLPADAVALEWGYEADHPFAERCGAFAAAGLPCYACPGTSSWNSLAGRPENALANVSRAAVEGLAAGASGLLVTDWGDNGHLQPLPISYPGLAAAAARAWNVAEGLEGLPAALSAHAFDDRAGVLGPLLLELGDAQLEARAPVVNGTLCFRLLVRPEPLPEPLRRRLLEGGLCSERLERVAARVDQVLGRLGAARMQRHDAPLIAEELAWAAEALRLACALGQVRLEVGLEHPLAAASTGQRTALAGRLRALIAGHRRLWLRRSRPGGLDDSAARLEAVLAVLCGP